MELNALLPRDVISGHCIFQVLYHKNDVTIVIVSTNKVFKTIVNDKYNLSIQFYKLCFKLK